MWSRIAKRTTTTDGCTKSKNTYNRHFKNNSFLGDKTKIKRRAIKKRKILFVIPNKVSIFAPVK
ncbi:hypothetical protein HMPREF1018_02760 [Bacteroides fragilis]|nr:hypothetical protein HMPREF1018_02760 [Bacteroides fragilis]